MASHGIPRVSAEVKTDKAIKEEQKAIEEYKDLVENVHRAIENKDYTHKTLEMISKLLIKNPEYYTIWNFRRRVLQKSLSISTNDHEPNPSTSTCETILANDLDFLLPLLIKYPKCYWIWNHRHWLLQQSSVYCSSIVSKRFWQRELGLIGKMLTRDSRNFHGWSYRREVITEVNKLENIRTNEFPDNRFEVAATRDVNGSEPSLLEEEFDYTTKQLRQNLSNFSAWHNRSKLIPRLLIERDADRPARRQMFDDELRKVEDALVLDPFDQSLWFYHQYLVTSMWSRQPGCFGSFTNKERLEYLDKDIDTFEELLDDFDDCKWILQKLLELSILKAELQDGERLDTLRKVGVWLARLKELDPLRKGRWDDLTKYLESV